MPSPPTPIAARNRAMITLSIAMFLAVLDSVIANVALPAIGKALQVDPTDAVWVVNAYAIAMAVSLLPLASLGDIIGHRRIYLFGLTLFAIASLVCGLSNSLSTLVGARIFQGLGAAGIASVNMALVRQVYPPEKLGSGMGILGLVVAAAATAGASIATAILALGPWPWLFLVNCPFALLALILAIRSLPSVPGTGGRFDVLSAVLNALGFGFLFIGAEHLAHAIDARALAEFATGLVFFGVFVWRELRLPVPMMPVDLMRLPAFAITVVVSISSYVCQTLVFLVLPFYFQDVGGQSQTQIGVLMTFWPAALIVAAPAAGRLSDRYSAGALCGAGLVLVTIGLLFLLCISPDASWMDVAIPMLVCGTGFGFFQSSNNREFMVAAPPARSGACAGMMTTSRLTGQTVGGLILTIAFALAGPGAGGVRDATHVSMTIAIGFAALAAAASLARFAIPKATR